MTGYSFDPTNVNIRRVKGLAESLGGSAQVVRPTRSDGTPGVAMLVVEVPDDVTAQQVQGIVDTATGITDADQATWERQRKRQAAKAALRDADDTARIATIAAIREFRAELIALGVQLRPWAQYVERVETRIDAEVT